MQWSLKLEESLMFIFGVYLFSTLNFEWWWFPALILLPDIGMLGYVINSKVGAVCYNLFHHKALAIALYLAGLYIVDDEIQLIGIILFSHSAMDRMFGYGLKYFKGFKHTHLGTIGKS